MVPKLLIAIRLLTKCSADLNYIVTREPNLSGRDMLMFVSDVWCKDGLDYVRDASGEIGFDFLSDYMPVKDAMNVIITYLSVFRDSRTRTVDYLDILAQEPTLRTITVSRTDLLTLRCIVRVASTYKAATIAEASGFTTPPPLII